MLPLGNCKEKSEDEECSVRAANTYSHTDKYRGDRLAKAGGNYRADEVKKNSKYGEEIGRTYTHRHIKAREEIAGEYATKQVGTVFTQNLQISLAPTKSLIPGLSKLGRLVIIEASGVAVTHFRAVYSIVGGKLAVLDKGVERPTAANFLKNGGREHKSCSRNEGASTDSHSRTVKEY